MGRSWSPTMKDMETLFDILVTYPFYSRTLKSTFKRFDIDSFEIESMGFSTRSYNCLKSAGISTMNDVSRLSPADIHDIRNLGGNSLWEILSGYIFNLRPVERGTSAINVEIGEEGISLDGSTVKEISNKSALSESDLHIHAMNLLAFLNSQMKGEDLILFKDYVTRIDSRLAQSNFRDSNVSNRLILFRQQISDLSTLGIVHSAIFGRMKILHRSEILRDFPFLKYGILLNDKFITIWDLLTVSGYIYNIEQILFFGSEVTNKQIALLNVARKESETIELMESVLVSSGVELSASAKEFILSETRSRLTMKAARASSLPLSSLSGADPWTANLSTEMIFELRQSIPKTFDLTGD